MVQDDVEPDEVAGAAVSPSGPEASNGNVHQSSDFLLVFFQHSVGFCCDV